LVVVVVVVVIYPPDPDATTFADHLKELLNSNIKITM